MVTRTTGAVIGGVGGVAAGAAADVIDNVNKELPKNKEARDAHADQQGVVNQDQTAYNAAHNTVAGTQSQIDAATAQATKDGTTAQGWDDKYTRDAAAADSQQTLAGGYHNAAQAMQNGDLRGAVDDLTGTGQISRHDAWNIVTHDTTNQVQGLGDTTQTSAINSGNAANTDWTNASTAWSAQATDAATAAHLQTDVLPGQAGTANAAHDTLQGAITQLHNTGDPSHLTALTDGLNHMGTGIKDNIPVAGVETAGLALLGAALGGAFGGSKKGGSEGRHAAAVSASRQPAANNSAPAPTGRGGRG